MAWEQYGELVVDQETGTAKDETHWDLHVAAVHDGVDDTKTGNRQERR